MTWLLNFSKTNAAKFTLYGLAGFGVLFLALGGIFAATTSTVRPSAMSLTGPNMINLGTGMYRLEMRTPHSIIQVNTDPWDMTTHPVTFTVGQYGGGIISVTNSVRTGESAIVTLDVEAFLSSPPQRMQIEVQCNHLPAIVDVVVVLTDSQVEWTSQLQYQMHGSWLPTTHLSASRDVGAGDWHVPHPHRLHITFRVMGLLIYDTAVRPGDFAHFSFSETDGTESGITFTQNRINVPDHMYGRGVVRFNVSVNFFGDMVHTHIFTINLTA